MFVFSTAFNLFSSACFAALFASLIDFVIKYAPPITAVTITATIPTGPVNILVTKGITAEIIDGIAADNADIPAVFITVEKSAPEIAIINAVVIPEDKAYFPAPPSEDLTLDKV